MTNRDFVKIDEWKIIEEGFQPELNKEFESLCSIGNGHVGQRANFEEKYSGDTFQGSYLGGIYYPDKTKVGWWKNGYPEYFAKVLNAPNWIGLNITINGVELDLATAKVSNFRRELNMKEGILFRTFTAELENGNIVEVNATRFISLVDKENAVVNYVIKAVNFEGEIAVESFVDADIENEDSNYDEKFWVEVAKKAQFDSIFVQSETKKTKFDVITAARTQLMVNGQVQEHAGDIKESEKFLSLSFKQFVEKGDEFTIRKYVTNVTSLNCDKKEMVRRAEQNLVLALEKGYETMKEEQAQAWLTKWKEADIVIEGDVRAQQAIRFNIFQLYQTYMGDDARLNIGPKGFTGEKYGGSTYWDTEAYCLPFYMSTAPTNVARNLLKYRHNQLGKAIENAAKLGFKDGAALYPMVTINGEECHNEWEITFEEIHRNGAIAYAVYNYINYTGEEKYLAEYGFDVLLGISRFWSQRSHYSKAKDQYMMHGVTGPNEYENNVNNNWYTNTIAVWTLKYTKEVVAKLKANYPAEYAELVAKNNFDEAEMTRWDDIIAKMYFPFDEERQVFIQHDNFLDKELLNVNDLTDQDRPLNQKWSWDRILRSVFIKQADVLQGIYLFEKDFDVDTIKRNFDFYEPMTVHESSLSPCIHSILAAKIGNIEKAYEFYLRTARLDLDDYNVEAAEGCHITSMAGTWMSIVQGFAGMRVIDGELQFTPQIPKEWDAYKFTILFKGSKLRVNVAKDKTTISNEGSGLELVVNGVKHKIEANSKLEC